MSKREDAESMEPGSLAWRRMQARKFIWFDGDVEIIPIPEEASGKEPPRPHEDDSRPDEEVRGR